MKRTPHPTHFRDPRGFSLIELLVVISLISIMVGLSFPTLSALREGNKIAAATNTVSVAVDAARFLAITSNDFTLTGLPGGYPGSYDGSAIIFTPSGECRLVVNDQAAQNGAGRFYELYDQDPTYPSFPEKRNAFKDVPGRDYIIMPPGTDVAGMRRNGPVTATDPGIVFIAPPFAVMFDENGRQVSRGNSGSTLGAVYYDANQNGRYTGSSRPGTYDPDDWDARQTAVDQVGAGTATDIDRRRYELPFEEIESVQAVAVYNRDAFDQLVPGGWAAGSDDDIYAFMTDPENAQVLFFSRGTGVVIRN